MTETKPEKRAFDMRTIKNIVLALSLIVVLIVVLQNTQSVETKVLFVSFSMPRALLLAITLVVGIIAGLLMGSRFSRKKQTSDV
jgi:uncharacterized integral membrane protein